MGSQGNMHTCPDACTHSFQVVELDEVLLCHSYGAHRSTHICAQLCQGDETGVVSQVDKHTHTDACTLSNQGLGTGRGVTGPHSNACLYAPIQGGGADVGSQLDMYTCIDACTHTNQGVGTDGG